jgi:hypothetical protein
VPLFINSMYVGAAAKTGMLNGRFFLCCSISAYVPFKVSVSVYMHAGQLLVLHRIQGYLHDHHLRLPPHQLRLPAFTLDQPP